MGRSARSELFDPAEVSVFHCINRCVRRCFLCGKDPLTGVNYEHRREWIEARIRYLAAYFGIDVLGFAVLENHFHVILRNRPDIVANWSDQEVAIRWLMLCPARKRDDGSAEEPSPPEIAMIVNDPERLAEIRTRLSHISWFMRMVAEPVARRANLEENVSGRFWQGRFRSVKLCDEAAVLACSVYVDLNPIRAGISQAVEDGPHTSAALRAKALREPACKADASLAPIKLDERIPGPKPTSSGDRCSDKGFLPLSVEDYLQLVDWTGRQFKSGASGRVPDSLAPILIRLGIETTEWVQLTTNFGRLFYRLAGSRSSLATQAVQHQRRWYQAPGGELITAAAA